MISSANEAAQRAGAQEDLGELFRLSAAVARARGELGRARELIDQALKELRSAQSRLLLAFSLAESSSLATAMGDLARAERELAEAGSDVVPETEGTVRLARAELDSAQGRFADSVTEARWAAESLDKAHADTVSARAFLVAADALEMQSQTGDALAACRKSETRAARVPNPVPLALARICEWRLSAGQQKEPLPDAKNPEVGLAHAYGRAMLARRSGTVDAGRPFDALAQAAEARGYITLARRASALAQAVK